MGKIVLISPSFFNIERYIKEGFQQRGYEVQLFDERIDNRKTTKVILRKFPILMQRRLNNYYEKILTYIDHEVDILLIIKAESVPVWFLNKVKEDYPEIKMVHYMFDPISNYPKILSKTDYFDLNLTFDHKDAKKYRWRFRPLFIPPSVLDEKTESNSFQSENVHKKGAFIGTLHTDRCEVMSRIIEQLPRQIQKEVFIYFYIPLWSMFIFGKYIKRNFLKCSYALVHKKPLDSEQTKRILGEADYVIDLHHDNQSGLTFRTMEVLGLNKKLITTNPNIIKYDFYNPNNILVVDKNNPQIDEIWFEKKYQKIEDEVYFKYTIDGFVQDIIDVVQE